MIHPRSVSLVCFCAIVLVSCGARDPQPPGDAYTVEVDPDSFVEGVDNPYFPLQPGSTYVYETRTDEGVERIEVEVLAEKRDVMGISATVVRDTVTLDGELVEDTFDWYAQDADGDVWYLGEDVSNYENGVFSDKAGSWEAGVDGAQPGVIMYAHPSSRIGESYRQEYYVGHAEDMADLVAADASVTVPAGAFVDVVKTLDYTPLEPDLKEEKYYAVGIGLVKAVNLATGEEELLIGYTTP